MLSLFGGEGEDKRCSTYAVKMLRSGSFTEELIMINKIAYRKL